MDQEQEIGTIALAAADQAKEDRERRRRAESHTGRKRKPLDSPALAAALTVVLVIFTALNLSGHGLLPQTPEPTKAQQLRSLEQEIDLLGIEIEARTELTGEVPVAIDDLVPPALEAWSYEKLGPDRYRLSLTMDGRTLQSESRVSG
jgi:hypothetical protein